MKRFFSILLLLINITGDVCAQEPFLIVQKDTNKYVLDHKNVRISRGSLFNEQSAFFSSFKLFHSKIIDSVDLHRSKFAWIIHLERNVFTGYNNWFLSEFVGGTIISKNIFEQGANFYSTKFNGDDPKFRSYIVIIDFNEFKGIVDFSHAVFNSRVTFNGCSFNNNVYFNEVAFHRGAFFSNTSFNCSLANFSGLKLHDSGRLDFQNARLPDFLDFSKISHIPNEIDLTVSDFTNPIRYDSINRAYRPDKLHTISLYKSDISKFRIDYLHFSLYHFNSETGLPLPYDEMAAQYESLLTNFQTHGQKMSYERLDIEYHDYNWDNADIRLFGNKFIIVSWLHYFPKYWNMYGYKKGWVFGWSVLFLLIFTIINFFYIDRLNNKQDGVYNIENIPDLNSFQTYKLHCSRKTTINRAWLSFAYTASIFFLFWLKTDKLKMERKGWILYLMFIYTIGLVCIAYMANFVLKQ